MAVVFTSPLACCFLGGWMASAKLYTASPVSLLGFPIWLYPAFPWDKAASFMKEWKQHIFTVHRKTSHRKWVTWYLGYVFVTDLHIYSCSGVVNPNLRVFNYSESVFRNKLALWGAGDRAQKSRMCATQSWGPHTLVINQVFPTCL